MKYDEITNNKLTEDQVRRHNFSIYFNIDTF